MYLKSLEVQGFKSFPDKTLIRFGDDITAIVGPNGSGKSNISDAILWVMGEQSTRTLRGTKMEDVIFGGTQKRSAVGFAEATLTLDNTDRALAYDADEVMVTRRYYRSGDSEFYINRQSARLRDIHELFMDTGLGREGYSNIGQGRIDEILSLKSGDRREIFEEAAGISKFRHRKEETERQLARTEENLLRIGDKVSELELQLEPLRVQSQKAKQYLALKDELKGLEVALWLDQLTRLSAAAQKAQEDFQSASFVLQQARDDLDALYARGESLTQALRDKDVELENARVKVNMLDSRHHQIEGQISVLSNNVENNRLNVRRIQEEMQGSEDRSGGICAQIQQTEDRIREIDAALEQRCAQLEQLSKELASITASAQGMTRQYLELKAKETELSADIAGTMADLRGIQQSAALSQERLQQLEDDLTEGAGRHAMAQDQLDASKAMLQSAREEVQVANNTIAGYQLRLKTRAQRRDALAQTMGDITGKLQSVSTQARVFRAMERDYDSYGKAVKSIMQEAQRGTLKGIHGPVSRLIRTADEYTVATEIALGAAMQHIVVDTEEDGKAALSFLKRTGGGRVTLLPLKVIQGKTLTENGLEDCQGFVGIASELVSYQPQYRNIIENLLGRTVIVENINFAVAMARRYHYRFRIVTLDGQIVNAGGSMTGGSVNREANILSRANELEKLTAQEQELQKKQAQTQAELSEAQRLVDQVEFQLTAVRDQLREAEDQVIRLEGQVSQHEIILNAVADAETAARRECEALKLRQQSDRERIAADEAKIEVYQRQLQQTQTTLDALEGFQNEAALANSQMNDRMTAIKTDAAALEAERVTAQAHMADLQQLRADMEGDREKKQALIDSMEEEIAQLQSQIDDLRALQAENDEEVAQQNQILQQILTQRMEMDAAKTRTDRDIMEKNKEIENMVKACSFLENKKVTSAMEEKQIIDKLWDTYGLTPSTAEEYRGQMESMAAGQRRISDLKRKITMLGTPNLGAIEEFERVSERYNYLHEQQEDVLTAKRELERIIRDITREMTVIFVDEFRKIDQHFGQVFEEMFGGGKGQLVLEDPENPLSCGIEIRVQPPGKQLKTITLLSGGEKAFVATALYFAILKVRPTPFCLLDEIDAALDDRNVERFANYLRNLSRRTQFIVITHRRGTMEASDVLYGVTMQEQGVSKLLRLDLNQMEEYLGVME